MSIPAQAVQTAVDYTISQDFAAGYIAEQEKNLQGFLENGQVRLGATNFKSKAAREDYQMQLLLLEQQNKKRLLMARHEQDTEQEQKQEQKREALMSVAQQMAATRKRPRDDDTQAEPSCGNSPSAPRTRRSQRKCAGGSTVYVEPFDKNSQQAYGSSVTAVNQDATGHDRSNLEKKKMRGQPILPHSRIIYRINCTDKNALQHHTALAFEDVPVPGFTRDTILAGQRRNDSRQALEYLHMEGTRPINDLDSCLTAEDDVAFIIVRETYCSEGARSLSQSPLNRVWYENLWLKSAPLRLALASTASCFINDIKKNQHDIHQGEKRITNNGSLVATREVYLPHLFLYHHRVHLRGYAADHPDALSHVRALLEYTSEVYGGDYREADELFGKGLVTSRHLVKLFAPNELVFASTDDQPTAYVVQQWPTMNSEGYLQLECWSWKSDGAKFVRKKNVLTVLPPQFDDEQIEIRHLSVAPLAYESPEIRSYLEFRGRKHWSLRSQSYPDSRFMIDYQTYFKFHPSAAAYDFDRAEKYPFDTRPMYLDSNADCNADLYCLMAPDTYGFYFTEKKWINLLVENIQPVEWNKSAYDRLVLPVQTKELVRALVTVRTSQRGVKQGLGLAGKREDIISGKGNGLIMLLHGGPAKPTYIFPESVAEIAEMPLYSVTCGDIGTNADAVEKYLNNVLYLGKTWNCVLLLDEADVFLEERSLSDLKRNSLVSGKNKCVSPRTYQIDDESSVFLRILEYYDGILILTSNRVGTFDEAFKSRIQVALHYEALKRSSRRKIWQNFLDMMREDKENVIFDELRDRLDELADLDMNGRQIRNSLTTARQLAIYKKEPLAWDHLEGAIKIAEDFNRYLKSVHGHTDEQWAREEKIRAP
ncbi:MAG: hypothetical protein ASARMPREDX12_007125 [Alectoria sarmentosa]|nr:MAG: hypothetical protein ASARMPREDX12_007125 [Alectoria sarmentosa]